MNKIDNIYKVESPPIIPLIKLDIESIRRLQLPEVDVAIQKANEEYLHWEDLKYKSWLPAESLQEKIEFWSYLKRVRRSNSITSPIRDASGNFYKISPKNYTEFLHIIDKEMAGNFMGLSQVDESDRRQFITRNIIEESIASSQLEGANTSREVAKRMLLEGRRPLNHGEKMIVNSHVTMRKIEQTLYKEKLSVDLIFDLHRMITKDTLAENKQGVLRNTLDDKGNRLVVERDDGKIAYVTPDREFVEKELPRLIAFANGEEENVRFIHPLIKGIMLHFWLGLLHPFEDGNGRLARVLFYWYMLRNDYWAFAYLSLSEKIIKSKGQYSKAYIYSEQDDYDLTYFIQYNIEKLELARKDFQHYMRTKVQDNKDMVLDVQKHHSFNERQIKLLQYLHQKKERRTSPTAHQKIYNVSNVTAANDLRKLLEEGFLEKRRQGNNVFYYPTKKIKELFSFD